MVYCNYAMVHILSMHHSVYLGFMVYGTLGFMVHRLGFMVHNGTHMVNAPQCIFAVLPNYQQKLLVSSSCVTTVVFPSGLRS